ncbi:serine/threonine-protein phosphatase 4 regulatory subunit 2 [Phlebotomus argentipes]|uniref:serine/threonine-protein phosphatase 4 regulatory subunit 2 n=1 Tax=Phlebotomus argentipes TaxID=94469 RepID=UPI0028934609|nr:serine/threonine-protein phosphatase 4 regulatory subunit 2 [Phlebotomus argentipes]
MLVMENPEEVLQILERFTKLKPKEIPQELEEYIRHVAKTGDTVYRWPNIKYLFREKLVNVIKQFHESTPSIEDLPQYPNVDPFNYETMKNGLLERLDTFNAAPFTIQRISELLSDPRKQYTRIDKFMRAVEKNILVVSTIEPGRKATDSENGDSLDSMQIEWETLTPSAAVIMAEVAAVAKFVSSASKSPTQEDTVGLPDSLEAPDIESDVNITDSLSKFDESSNDATPKDETTQDASTSAPLVVIKPLEVAETVTKEAFEEEEEEEDEKTTSVEAAEVTTAAENASEEPEKTDSDNTNATISSSSSDDSNSTDDNESLTGQTSDVPESSAVAPEAIPAENSEIQEPAAEETSSLAEEKSPEVTEEPVKAAEEPPEEAPAEEIVEPEAAPAAQSPPIAFHPTEEETEQEAELRDRTEDGEPVCKKPMESDMLVEVPPALPLEDIPPAAVDVVSQMVADESLLMPPSEELPKEATAEASPPAEADLILPLEVADMEVAPAASEVSEMATEETKTDDAMEVDESSMEPMDQ